MPSWGGAASGAATGAQIGSFIPGIGNLIGGGIGALFGGLFGGGGDDKPKTNPEDPYTKILTDSAQEHQAQGRELSNLGSSDLAPVVKYFKDLASGNPAAVMDATRQERGRVIDQYDTARRAISNFGPRGGGAVSANAQSQFAQAESLADTTSAARHSAMGGAAALGTSLTGLALSADQLASADLNTVINSVLAREGLASQRRGQNMALAGDIGETVGGLIGIALGRDSGGGGGGGGGNV